MYFNITAQEDTAEELCQNTSESNTHVKHEINVGIISGIEKQSKTLFFSLYIFCSLFCFFHLFKCDHVAGAAWTNDATSILLKSYEEKLEMLETPKKKTRIWIAIADSLKKHDIEVSLTTFLSLL